MDNKMLDLLSIFRKIHYRPAVHVLSIFIFLFPITASSVAAQSIYKDLQWPFYSPSSSVCDPTSSESLAGSDVPQKIWNYLISPPLNFSKIAAAAIVGNIQHETAGTFDPRINNGGKLSDYPISNSRAYGLVQWLDAEPKSGEGRQTSLVAKAKAAGVIPGDLGIQLDYMQEELLGSYFKGKVTDLINSPTATIESATQVVYDVYEGLKGSGQGSAAGRVPAALNALTLYGNGEATSGSANTGADCFNLIQVPSGTCVATAPVYDRVLSEEELQRIFGPPVRNSSANLVNVNFFGSTVPAHKYVAPCLEAVANDLLANGIAYRPSAAKDGFWCTRDYDGQVRDKSYHIYGAACDLNPYTNNYFSDGRDRPYNPNCPIASDVVDAGSCYDIPPEVVAIFERHGFKWGGNFRSIKDYMHFEWHGIDPDKPIPSTPALTNAAEAIVETALQLAWPDGSHGNKPTPAYEKANKQYNAATDAEKTLDSGRPSIELGADCSVFVSVVMRMSGVDPNYAPGARCGTKDQQKYLTNNPSYQIINVSDPTNLSVLQPGDILVANDATGCDAGGHTLIWLGTKGGKFNAAQSSWSSDFKNADMPYLFNKNSLEWRSGIFYTIARHK